MTDTTSSVWRTAYVSALFETDAAKLSTQISDARAAIKDRLNSNIEINRLEHEAIQAAQQRLMTLQSEPVNVVNVVDVVRSVPTKGDTNL